MVFKKTSSWKACYDEENDPTLQRQAAVWHMTYTRLQRIFLTNLTPKSQIMKR